MKTSELRIGNKLKRNDVLDDPFCTVYAEMVKATKTYDMMGFEVIGFDEDKTFDEKCRIAKLHFQRMNDMVNDSEREFNTMLSQNLSKKNGV